LLLYLFVLQVELPSIATISGIVTQGKDGSDKEWVTKYRVLYSEDCKSWSVVIGPTGSVCETRSINCLNKL